MALPAPRSDAQRAGFIPGQDPVRNRTLDDALPQPQPGHGVGQTGANEPALPAEKIGQPADRGGNLALETRPQPARDHPLVHLDRPLQVADEISHKLEQAQDAFCGEWLVLPGDKDAESQHRSYTEAELAWSEVNFQFRQLNKFVKDEPVWLYYSKNFEAAVARYVMRRWTIDYCS